MPARTDAFSSDGFVVVRDAIAPDVVRRCVEAIEDELRRHGVDPRDRTTWTEPVVRLACPEGPAFAEAGTSPALRAAHDELLGPGRWIRREGVGGTLPVRFPSLRDPGDAAGTSMAATTSTAHGGPTYAAVGGDSWRCSCSPTSAMTMRRQSSSLARTSTSRACSRRLVSAACSMVTSCRISPASPSSALERERPDGRRRLPLPSVSCSSRNVAASRRRTAHGGSAGGGDPGAIHVARRSRPVPRRANDPARPRGEVAVTAGQPLAVAGIGLRATLPSRRRPGPAPAC